MKSDGSPVTEADLAAEEAVLACVEAERPGDGFIGEEVGERSGTTGRRWIVDGIDSTKSFAAGLKTWGTLIALETNVQTSPLRACADQRPHRRLPVVRSSWGLRRARSRTAGGGRLVAADRSGCRPSLTWVALFEKRSPSWLAALRWIDRGAIRSGWPRARSTCVSGPQVTSGTTLPHRFLLRKRGPFQRLQRSETVGYAHGDLLQRTSSPTSPRSSHRSLTRASTQRFPAHRHVKALDNART